MMKAVGYILWGLAVASFIAAAVEPDVIWVALLMLGLALSLFICCTSACTARPKTTWALSIGWAAFRGWYNRMNGQLFYPASIKRRIPSVCTFAAWWCPYPTF